MSDPPASAFSTVRFAIPTKRGALAGLLHRPSDDPSIPLVILSHGLLSSMASPKFGMLSDSLCRSGMAAVRFDYHGCGDSEGDLYDTTVSGRVEDLYAVIDHVVGEHRLDGPLGLLGSSLGGYVSLLTAQKRPGIKAVCTWATPFDLKGLAEHSNHPDLDKLGPGFFEDAKKHDLGASMGGISRLLVLHGERDEIVPEAHAHKIHRSASEPKALHVIPSADHRFSDPKHRQRAADLSIEWFRRHLFDS